MTVGLRDCKMDSAEVLAAGGEGLVVVAKRGSLYVSGQNTHLARVCGAAVSSKDCGLVSAISQDKEVLILSCQNDEEAWKVVTKQ